MTGCRALHFVFKIGDRKKSFHFYRDILGMKVLRHEEFEEGCKATCNGPYDGKWSKTMIGYGSEDQHFVCELTYNYGISNYEIGNDFSGLFIQSAEAIQRAKSSGYPTCKDEELTKLIDPNGYSFYLIDEPQPTDNDPVQKVGLSCSNFDSSLQYWHNLLGMTVFAINDKDATLGYSTDQVKLVIKSIGVPINHAKGYGRIAFCCPSSELKPIEEKMIKNNQKIVTPFVSLDTPGKATVQVVILADPDDHEICFVGAEGFHELSQVDPKANDLLNEAIAKDKSNEWFAAKGGKADA